MFEGSTIRLKGAVVSPAPVGEAPRLGDAIVGRPEQVIAERLAYWRLGIDGFILSGFPHDDECRCVGSAIPPGLRDAIRREP